MQQPHTASARGRLLGTSVLVPVLLCTAGCGGGGSDSSPATVTSMSIAPAKYGTPTQITITGTHLGNLTLTAPGCKNLTLLTAAPTASNDTTAYYACTPSGAYTSTITASSGSTTLSTKTLTVLPPIVTMAVSGSGVNGNIVFNLRGDKAPITVDNFLAYVNSSADPTKSFYAGTIFHRVVAGFVVQGGGYGAATSGTLPTPKTPLYNPITLETTGGSNVQWTAAMARTADDNSATSQFFINLADNHATLDKSASTDGYAVFADVTASASVVQAIAAAKPCTALLSGGLPLGDGSCVPIPNVVIISAQQTQ